MPYGLIFKTYPVCIFTLGVSSTVVLTDYLYLKILSNLCIQFALSVV